MQRNVDIHYGLDYEQAWERLNLIAGKTFRQYWKAKHGDGSDEEVARLRQAYLDAQHEQKALSRRDEVAIRATLARPI